MRAAVLCSVFLFLSSIPGITGTVPPRAGDRPIYRHAYYLFLADTPRGCEDCYVPLLITTEPLEQVARAKGSEACVVIITYERDSIWHDDGIVSLEPRDIEAASRIVHLGDRKYRYQEISSAEVLKLLENPMGTISISRPMLPNAGSPGPTLEDLILAFRDPK
jgi:hypothetical protein